MITTLTEFKNTGLNGKIDVRYPTNGERMKLFSKSGMDFFEIQKKISDTGKDKDLQTEMMQSVIMSVMDYVGPFCESVEIEYKGEKIDSFDGIATKMELIGLQVQIASTVLLGARSMVEKKAKKSVKR